MSFTKEATIWCDHDDCNRWWRNGSSSVTETREAAKEKGWTSVGGKDYCPEH